ncbi:MAG: hypothetical protein M5R38_07255 [Candidatus Methylomirabilis sp.]|nr:hypothetical protein [Candidatus Methylomirabilis sp.]
MFRIAGLDPQAIGQAQLSEELVRALAQDACDVAGRFLDICIRAIDYCPPVDLEMGEYLRALVTADSELVPDDKLGYREALMRSFRRRRIFPDHVQFMTEDAVRWQEPPVELYVPGLAFKELRFDGDPGHPADADELRRQGGGLGCVHHNRRPCSLVSSHRSRPASAQGYDLRLASAHRVDSMRAPHVA